MKIRSGFVSNSSSSSFVVAFPKKPKTVKDVWKYMFYGKEGGLSVYDYDGLTYEQVARNVFNDLEHKSFKQATFQNIVEEFQIHYDYYPSQHNVLWMGRTDDDTGGAWLDRLGRYYGSDSKLMNQLRQCIIDSEKQDEIDRTKEDNLLVKNGLKHPKYACVGGTDFYTKKPYTKAEIQEYDKYTKAIQIFRETNSEYIAFKKERDQKRHKRYELRYKLCAKIAKKDAQNFLDDNKGKFIFIVSYSDNDGVTGCTMEHGNIFRNVPHVIKSHH